MMAGSWKCLAAAAMIAVGFSSASAHAESLFGTGPDSVTRQVERFHHRGPDRGWHPQRGGNQFVSAGWHQRDIIGGDGLPSYIHGVGTFAGGIVAARFPGNGIYMYVDPLSARTVVTLPPKAKIIHISGQKTAKSPDSACAVEHGVCVIRGTP